MERMKIGIVFVALLMLSFTRVSLAQELKKEFIDQQAQESRSAAVKVKGGTMLFLAGHTASQPRPDAELGNFDTQFKAVFDKIANTLAQRRRQPRRHRIHERISDRSALRASI